MSVAIAVWRVLACPLAVPAGVLGTDRGTTEGGRDKRRGTTARHVVGVDREIPCHAHHRGAAHPAKSLALHAFHRAATHFDGAGR